MKSLVVCCILLTSRLFASPTQGQPNPMDSLEKLLVSTPADTNRVLLLNKLSKQHLRAGINPEKVKSYAEQALQLANQLHYPFGIGEAYDALGGYYYTRNQNQDALQQYEKALKFYEQSGRKVGVAMGNARMAIVSEDMGNYPKAMAYYIKSTQLAEELGDTAIIAKNLGNMGVFMLSQKKYEQALQYLFRALPLYESLKDDQMKMMTLINISVVYQESQQYDKAQQYLNQGLVMSNSLQSARGQVMCYNNLGSVNLALERYDQALGYYQKALAIGEPQGYHQSMSIAMEGIAAVYLKKGETAQSISNYKKSLQLAEANQLVKQKLDAYEGLREAYVQLKDYSQAYLYQSQFFALKDSLFNKESTQKMAQLEASYEVEKKQIEIELLHKDQQQEGLVRNAILAGLLASLIITGLVINRQRLKTRQNQLLEKQAKVMTEQANQLTATNAQLEQQTHQLQELDQVKSNFFTNISHEFRTPLTLILAPLEKLMAGHLEVSQAKGFYQLIDRNARHLLHLINQLLDFSKLEAGSLKIELTRGDVHQRLKALTFSFASLAESKRIQLAFRSDYQSIQALYDPDILDKILNNLLSNAFKFTPAEGKVTVGVALQPAPGSVLAKADSEAGWQLEITVKDTGLGIPSDQTDRIFDRFYQIDGSQLREQPGTGIGLALVKELVALQQGSISVSSEVGLGTGFTVCLPLAACSFEVRKSIDQPEAVVATGLLTHEEDFLPELPSLPVRAEPNEKCPVMLLVEDNDEVREFVRESFLDEFRVIGASNGAEGLKMAQKDMPDIIITDRMMPKMDGMELCRQLKTDERTSHIPVILLTAKASEESKIEGLETGADDYILKPFSLQELTVRVKNLIAQRKQLRERFSREVKLQPKDIAITSADEVFLHKAIRLIEEHMADTDFSVETFIHEIGMSRMQLHRKLKALTDQSTTEFIRSIRLKRAASLLEQHYGNVAEVMYEVGFSNVSYFASNFRKMFGVNPSEYHSSAQQKEQLS